MEETLFKCRYLISNFMRSLFVFFYEHLSTHISNEYHLIGLTYVKRAFCCTFNFNPCTINAFDILTCLYFTEERVQSAIGSLKAETGKQHVWVPTLPRHYALHFWCYSCLPTLLYQGIVHASWFTGLTLWLCVIGLCEIVIAETK